MVFMDLNDQLGYCTAHGYYEPYPHDTITGTYGKGIEHQGGTAICDWVQLNHMTAMLTQFPIGPTFYNDKGSSHIDHVFLPSGALPLVERAFIPRRAWR